MQGQREHTLGDRSGSTRSEEHTSELQSRVELVCRLLLEKKKRNYLCQTLIDHLPVDAMFQIINFYIFSLPCIALLEIIYEVHFFFIDSATTEIYTLSLHDALPI